MKTLQFGIGVLLLTFSILFLTWKWAQIPLCNLALVSSKPSPEERIRELFPVHIVNPAWVSSSPNAAMPKDPLRFNWAVAETKARVVVMFFLWFALLFLTFFERKRGLGCPDI